MVRPRAPGINKACKPEATVESDSHHVPIELGDFGLFYVFFTYIVFNDRVDSEKLEK